MSFREWSVVNKLLLSTTHKYLVLEFKLNNTAQMGPQSHQSFILNPNQKHCTSKPKDILSVYKESLAVSHQDRRGEEGPILGSS